MSSTINTPRNIQSLDKKTYIPAPLRKLLNPKNKVIPDGYTLCLDGEQESMVADLNNKEDVDRVMKGVNIVLQFAATTSGAKDITTKPFIHVTDNAVMNSLLLRSAYENNVEHFVFVNFEIVLGSV